ncbi:MAG: FtsL-like putative cell division protein [Chthoniobacterales bacterium]
MQRQRRKEYNTVNAASLARWIIVSVFLAAIGLIYVYQSVQLDHLGNQQKKLETELAAARLQNVEAKGQIAALTSRGALQRRLKEGYLKMIPITERNIVRLTPLTVPGEDAVQPVANQRAGR